MSKIQSRHTVTSKCLGIALLSVSIILFITGCPAPNHNIHQIDAEAPQTCEGCHTDATTLQELTQTDTVASYADYLGGSDSTTSDSWERVYIDLSSDQTEFKDIDPTHGSFGCTECHGGKEPSDYAGAHDINEGFVRDPSENPDVNCTPCHEDRVNSAMNSMHYQTWGIKAALTQRELGADKDQHNFDECPASITDGFDQECSTCHASCGQCHLSRPTVVGGGLLDSHRFIKTPDQENTCEVCHSQRIVKEYTGNIDSNTPDVHEQAGMKCLDCHTEDFHADASDASTYYEISDLPQCLDCHADADTVNVFHIQHWPDGNSYARSLDCQVCHAQSYSNCTSCHTDGEWTSDGLFSENTDLKLGVNPNRDERPNVKWVTLRHVPIDEDSYAPWGLSVLDEYSARPTWNHTSPHTISHITTRTDTTLGVFEPLPNEKKCTMNCHFHAGGTFGNERNRNLFVTRSFLLDNYPYEETANDSVLVDDGQCGSQCHSSW